MVPSASRACSQSRGRPRRTHADAGRYRGAGTLRRNAILEIVRLRAQALWPLVRRWDATAVTAPGAHRRAGCVGMAGGGWAHGLVLVGNRMAFGSAGPDAAAAKQPWL